MKKIISPSLLNASKSRRVKLAQTLFNLGIKWIHYDYMDAQFVESTAISVTEIQNITAKFPKYTSDVHLMCVNPKPVIEQLISHIDYATIHYESVSKDEIEYLISEFSSKIKIGIAIKPETQVESILYLLNKINLILVMSVNPGKGGQQFIKTSYEKISQLRRYIDEHKLDVLIQVDGGIKDTNAQKVFEAGADIVVVGTFLASKPSKQKVMSLLKN